MKHCLGLLCVLQSIACAGSPSGDGSLSVELPPPAPATASVAALPAQGPAPVGRFQSPSCGSRNYAREIEFRQDGTFTAKDHMATCPLGALCVWSGVMERSGTFTVSGSELSLRVTKGAELGGAQPLPQTLSVTQAAVVETIANATCAYTRSAP